MQLGWKVLDGRYRPENGGWGEIVGRRFGKVAIGAQHPAGVIERKDRRCRIEGMRERVEIELEPGDHAKIAPRAAHGPEEIGVLDFAGPAHLTVGRDNLHGAELVHGHSEFSMERTEAPMQGQPADTGRADLPSRGDQIEQGGFAVEIAPGGASLGECGFAFGIDDHGPHLGEVDHHPAVVDRVAGHVVAAAAYREQEILLPRNVHRGHHVGGAVAAGDERRVAVDQPIANHAGIVIGGISGLN